jgi:hypothetical protein
VLFDWKNNSMCVGAGASPYCSSHAVQRYVGLADSKHCVTG